MQKSLFENEMLNIVQKPTLHKTDVSRSTFYQGDCLVESQNVADGSVDLILTDLPYGTTACAWDEIIPIDAMWKMFYRVLRPNGFIVLTASQPFTSKLVSSNMNNFSHQWVWEKIGSNGNPLLANVMPLKNFEDVLVFGKKGYDEDLNHPLRYYTVKLREYTNYSRTRFRQIFGHWKFQHFMELQQQYTLCTEDVYNELTEYFELRSMDGFLEYSELVKTDYDLPKRVYNPQMVEGKPYSITSGKMGDAYGGELGGFTTISDGNRYPKSILRFGYCKEKLHPTQKPVELMEYLIKTYTNEEMTVFDATMGSGTTGVACKKSNRHFIGIEKDEKYFEIAVSRVSAYCG